MAAARAPSEEERDWDDREIIDPEVAARVTAGDSIPLNISFQPGEANVTAAEIYTNLNRRDRADTDADGDGYPDGVSGRRLRQSAAILFSRGAGLGGTPAPGIRPVG